MNERESEGENSPVLKRKRPKRKKKSTYLLPTMGPQHRNG
jgi:hypothetical protein